MAKLWILIPLFLLACTERAPLGSAKNPIKISIVPGKETGGLMKNATTLADWLEKETGYSFEATVLLSYIAVVEAMGTKRVDIAALSTSSYLIAREKYQVEPIFMTELNGKSTYKGQFITHVSGLKKLEDINGKKIAYVDPSSASGYLMARDLLAKKKIVPSDFVFAGGHDAVVTMVYTKKVDAGATFYSPEEQGEPKDARRLVKQQFPDVFKKVKILGFTDEIPNDALALRKDFPLEMKSKLIAAIDKWAKSPEGKITLKEMNNGSGLIPAADKDYDSARRILNMK
jgi:phosphonate transport system substrate-binding protein